MPALLKNSKHFFTIFAQILILYNTLGKIAVKQMIDFRVI